MVLALADASAIVVNQNTWTDQKYIEATIEKILRMRTEAAQRGVTDVPSSRIVIIHNFKDVTEQADLKALIDVVAKCDHGQLVYKKVNDDGTEDCPVFYTTDGTVMHTFLARDGSGAGNYINARTIAFLLAHFRITERTAKDNPLLPQICYCAETLLDRFFHEPGHPEVYYCGDGQFSIKTQASMKYHTTFSRGTTAFNPEIDIRKTAQGMVIVVSVSGIDQVVPHGRQPPADQPYVSWQVSKKHKQLILFGRVTSYVWLMRPGNPVPEIQVSSKARYANPDQCEIRTGEFSRTIDIPPEYDCVVQSSALHAGKLQLFLPAYIEDN